MLAARALCLKVQLQRRKRPKLGDSIAAAGRLGAGRPGPWRAQHGMNADDVKWLKELETENARLKRIVADQTLHIAALNEVAKGNW